MPAKSKSTKTSGSRKSEVKLSDMKPRKDAKGGSVKKSNKSHAFSGGGTLNQSFDAKPGHPYNEN
jgi:hypothetical protein